MGKVLHVLTTFVPETREDLKDQYLSFTEIAKIVGERWQCISKGERGEYERHARHARDKYRRELAEYKKTPEHEHYAQYLEDFKKKHQAAGKGKYPLRPMLIGRQVPMRFGGASCLIYSS